MEFTEELNNQLTKLRDTVALTALHTECKELATERSKCINEREELIERLNLVKEEYKNARIEELELQQKLEAARSSCIDYKNNHLETICEILGYKMLKYELLENKGLQVRLQYRDMCHVTYSEIDQTFELMEIYPQHFNFSKIQQFLRDSQDLRGLLSCLRKFFDLALEYKELQEAKHKEIDEIKANITT